MKTKLITGLRAAASAIEAGTFYYEWNKTAQCNCGSLFCALTGKSADEFKRSCPPPVSTKRTGTWTELVGLHCPITGMPTQELFKELFGYGMTQQDIINLEYLSDRRVKARMNLSLLEGNEQPAPLPPTKRKWYHRLRKAVQTATTPTPKLYYNNSNHVVAYMRAWADLLTEEGAMDVPAPTTQETVTQQD